MCCCAVNTKPWNIIRSSLKSFIFCDRNVIAFYMVPKVALITLKSIFIDIFVANATWMLRGSYHLDLIEKEIDCKQNERKTMQKDA